MVDIKGVVCCEVEMLRWKVGVCGQGFDDSIQGSAAEFLFGVLFKCFEY